MSFQWLRSEAEPTQFTKLREASVAEQLIDGEITGIGPIRFYVTGYSVSFDAMRGMYEGRADMRTADA